MEIEKHPIWTGVTPYNTRVSPYKKQLHLLRMYIARQYTKLFSRSKFIAVTGSVGKTSTVAAASAVLSKKFKVISSVPNLDPVFNIPITLLKQTPITKKVILEMGVEYPGEMDFYLELVQPKTAIVTRIAFQHSAYLGDLNEITKEKGKLLDSLPEDGLAILNYDDINVRRMAAICKANVIFYGTDAKFCQVWAGNVRIENFTTVFEINFGVERVKVTYQPLGYHQIYSALAAAALGLSEGISLVSIKNALEEVLPEEHRLQIKPGQSGSVIIDDTYNSAPVSVEAALEVLESLPARRRILVLGETKELGKYSEREHRRIAQKIYKDRPDFVILGTGDANFVGEELINLGFLPERVEKDLQNPQIVSRLLKLLGKGDVCLIKGSRSLRLDEVVDRVIKK